jgi:hypothetical protein
MDKPLKKNQDHDDKFFPNNCNVMEKTADGVSVGRCWFYLRDGICPRHGKQK